MTTRFLTSLFLLVFFCSAFAQQRPKDEFEVSDIPEEEARPYFGVGGGFNMQIVQPKFDDINAMAAKLGIPALDKGMLITGGAGFISAPFGKHLRIGGMGYGGKNTQCIDVVDTINGTPTAERRTAEFAMGAGGLTLEYVMPFAFSRNRLVFAGGLMLGYGSMSVQIDQTTSDPRTWDGFSSSAPTSNFTRQIHARYFAYQPQINLEYSLFAFLMIRASVGYHGTAVVGKWMVDRDIAISGVPSINGSGISYGGGIWLGIFR